jgi:hypothetical protein
MSVQFLNALIAAVGSVLVAAATYWLTKKQERNAELRKEKLEHYKAFIASLSGILEKESSSEGQKAFALACNNMLLFAPQSVLEALRYFQEETRTSNPNRQNDRHDELLSNLLLEIRKDLKVRPKDKAKIFKAWLWSSGVSS